MPRVEGPIRNRDTAHLRVSPTKIVNVLRLGSEVLTVELLQAEHGDYGFAITMRAPALR
jgi:hypothetical protein